MVGYITKENDVYKFKFIDTQKTYLHYYKLGDKLYYQGEISGEAELTMLSVFKEKGNDEQPYIYQQPIDSPHQDQKEANISGINILNNSFYFIKPKTFENNFGKLTKSIGEVFDRALFSILNMNDEPFKGNGVYTLKNVPENEGFRLAVFNVANLDVIEFKEGTKGFIPVQFVDEYDEKVFLPKLLPTKGYSVFYEDIAIAQYLEDGIYYIAFFGTKYGNTYQLKPIYETTPYSLYSFEFKGRYVYSLITKQDYRYRYDGTKVYKSQQYYLLKSDIVNKKYELFPLVYNFKNPTGIHVYGNMAYVLDGDQVVAFEYVDQTVEYNAEKQTLTAHYPFDFVKCMVNHPQQPNLYEWTVPELWLTKNLFVPNSKDHSFGFLMLYNDVYKETNKTVYSNNVFFNRNGRYSKFITIKSEYQGRSKFLYKNMLYSSASVPKIKSAKKILPDWLYNANYFRYFSKEVESKLKSKTVYKRVLYSKETAPDIKSVGNYLVRQIYKEYFYSANEQYQRNVDDMVYEFGAQKATWTDPLPYGQLLYYRMGINEIVKNAIPYIDYERTLQLKMQGVLDLHSMVNLELIDDAECYSDPVYIIDEDVIEYKHNQLYQYIKAHSLFSYSARIIPFITKATVENLTQTLNDDILYNLSVHRHEKESVGMQFQKQLQQFKTKYLNSGEQTVYSSYKQHHHVVDKNHPFYLLLFNDIKQDSTFASLKYGNLIIPNIGDNERLAAIWANAGDNTILNAIRERLSSDYGNSVMQFKIAGTDVYNLGYLGKEKPIYLKMLEQQKN